jgi:hypothetical protein
MSGNYEIDVVLEGEPIRGSPFALSIITLRPEASQCRVHGAGLRTAVSRKPQSFQIDFVDGRGHPSHAEELDVYVEWVGGVGADQTAVPRAVPTEQERKTAAVVAAYAAKLPSPPRSKDGGTSTESNAASPLPSPSTSPEGAVGTGDGGRSYRPLDAFARQRHETLWATRAGVDKWLAKRVAEKASKKKQFSLVPSTATELSEADPFGFAFGGLTPGLLHSHGHLSKTHSVHYSIGLAGKYRMHVGLRQQHVPLPGSPFTLEVSPGGPSANSTTIPKAERELRGVADEEWQHGLLLRISDMLGNACNEGGAKVACFLHKPWLNANPEIDKLGVDMQPVQWRVTDLADGTYRLEYRSHKSGAFPVEVTVEDEPVSGSPITLLVRAAQAEVERFALRGDGLSLATAGEPAAVSIKVHDRFGNVAEPNTALRFGLALVNADTTKADRGVRGKTAAGTDGKSAKDSAPKNQPIPPPSEAGKGKSGKVVQYKGFFGDSMEFKSELLADGFMLRYTPRESGTFDLHVWLVLDANANGGERAALPGSPFKVEVQMGSANATGSFVKGSEATPELGQVPTFAGEKLIVRPQLRDHFGNAAVAPSGEGALSAFLQPPVGELVQLEAPKPKGGVGGFEVILEPTLAGKHMLHVRLQGHEISGSPLRFEVSPAPFGDKEGGNKSVAKCSLRRLTDVPPAVNAPFTVFLTTIDRYGNKLTKGGCRIEAKGFGGSATACVVEDLKDGTYKITFSAGAPGEVKLVVKVDGSEVPPMNVQFVRKSNEKAAFVAAVASDHDLSIVSEVLRETRRTSGPAPPVGLPPSPSQELIQERSSANDDEAKASPEMVAAKAAKEAAEAKAAKPENAPWGIGLGGHESSAASALADEYARQREHLEKNGGTSRRSNSVAQLIRDAF